MLKTINAYVGTFEKKTGEERSMRFVMVSDLPEGFMASNTKGGQQRKLSEGNELVWDLDKKQFRVFNWNTVKGDVTQITNFRVDKLN